MIGLGFQSDKTPGEYVRLARTAEEAGVDVLSVYGDFGYQPPIVPLTLMAEATERVRLGPACLNPYSLAPHEIAGQTAALDLVSEGRAYLGLSRGTWLGAVGIDQPLPITTMRETVEVVRRLLRGDDRGFHGDVFRLEPGTSLSYEPARVDVPVTLGSWGPRTLALGGEVAEEVKVGGSANPDIVPWVREQVERGCQRAGRPVDAVGICVGAVTVVDPDGDVARDLARREVAMYLAVVADLDPTFVVDQEVLDEVRFRVSEGRQEEAGKAIPPEVLRRFAFAGTPAEVAAHAEAVFAAGAQRVEFGTPHGIVHEEGVRLIGERVVPAFR
ncbi:MAG: LLM class flavin-dependent oxidoreductase [Acidimicrobiia bacterium]|nr:LLM class flavin-dependent oxidoreductase [Acidimicrobiia bacterium]